MLKLQPRGGAAWRFALCIEPNAARLRRADRGQALEPDDPKCRLDRRRREPLETRAAGGVRTRRRRRAGAPLSGAAGRRRPHSRLSLGRPDPSVEPILAAFAEAYPDVVLNLTLDDEVVDVVAGGFDVAIRIGEVIEKDMVVAPLGKELPAARGRCARLISPSMASSGAPARSRPASLHSMALARPRDALRLGVFREWILVRGRRRRPGDRHRQGDGCSPGVEGCWDCNRRRERDGGRIHRRGTARASARALGFCFRFPAISFAIRSSARWRPALRAFIDAVLGVTIAPASHDVSSGVRESLSDARS